MTHVVIIGNGVAGITAARALRVREPAWAITVISGESAYHYSRPALMYVFMGHMRYQDCKPYEDDLWERENITLVRDWVVAIDAERSTLALHHGAPIAYDKLLIATGSKSNRFGWPGQDLPGVQGLYDLMDLKALYEASETARHATIVGGGLIGIELAEMLHSRNIHVTLLVREKSYWSNILPPGESALVNEHIREHGMDLRLETELEEILPGRDGRVARVRTKDGTEIDTQIVGLTAGVSPNIDLVRDTAIRTNRGVLVDWSLRTNIENIYAAGDCAEIVREGEERNLLQQVWYTGKMQGETVARAMAGEDVSYDPGIWYNSAKFLDLEYQTYGQVPARAVDGQTQLWWQHRNGKRGVRLVYDTKTKHFLGLNTIGIRYRHRVCESWLREQRDIEFVIANLGTANFDTEFFARDEREMAVSFREQMA
ncbi:MAG: NAD(P)/FAD-dependent oxidoreductase [Phycisphaerales bacterium]|nr:NAD(P)/FAD-dependent oxidoreductase [Phycisphaerales bacterium]